MQVSRWDASGQTRSRSEKVWTARVNAGLCGARSTCFAHGSAPRLQRASGRCLWGLHFAPARLMSLQVSAGSAHRLSGVRAAMHAPIRRGHGCMTWFGLRVLVQACAAHALCRVLDSCTAGDARILADARICAAPRVQRASGRCLWGLHVAPARLVSLCPLRYPQGRHRQSAHP